MYSYIIKERPRTLAKISKQRVNALLLQHNTDGKNDNEENKSLYNILSYILL